MGVSTKMANYSAVALTMSPGHARLNELTSRMQSVHDDFESEKKARSSVMELKCRAIDEKIMRNKRSEDERLKLLADINEVHNSIKQEGAIRAESETHIIRVLEDMCQKLHAEIQAERKDRQSTEQVFMKLLDETCESIALRASSKTLAELTKRVGN